MPRFINKGTMNSSSPSLATSDEPPPSNLPPVLVLFPPYNESWSSILSSKFTIIQASSPVAASTRVALVSGAYNQVDTALLDQYPSLRCIVTTSAGVNQINLEECNRRGIEVTNAGETYSVDVADYAVGLLIDALRRITMSDQCVRNGSWVTHGDYPLGSKLRGKRVGIVGLGGIGSAIAMTLEALGCKISYLSIIS